MIVQLGSKNPTKLDGLRAGLDQWGGFEGALITGIDVDTGVSEQPMSLDETAAGAENRARAAQQARDGADVGVGIEDGLMAVPIAESGYVNVCVCVMRVGDVNHIGLSSGFEYPKAVIDWVVNNKGLDISEAFKAAGLTAEEKIGNTQGAIGLLSNGVVLRSHYATQAVLACLAHAVPRHTR